jgi:hypothetical protein
MDISLSPSVIDNGLLRETWRLIRLRIFLATTELLSAYTKMDVFLRTTLLSARKGCIQRFGHMVIGTLKVSLSIRRLGMFGLTNTDHRGATNST